jgi:hypothetical protein
MTRILYFNLFDQVLIHDQQRCVTCLLLYSHSHRSSRKTSRWRRSRSPLQTARYNLYWFHVDSLPERDTIRLMWSQIARFRASRIIMMSVMQESQGFNFPMCTCVSTGRVWKIMIIVGVSDLRKIERCWTYYKSRHRGHNTVHSQATQSSVQIADLKVPARSRRSDQLRQSRSAHSRQAARAPSSTRTYVKFSALRPATPKPLRPAAKQPGHLRVLERM